MGKVAALFLVVAVALLLVGRSQPVQACVPPSPSTCVPFCTSKTELTKNTKKGVKQIVKSFKASLKLHLKTMLEHAKKQAQQDSAEMKQSKDNTEALMLTEQEVGHNQVVALEKSKNDQALYRVKRNLEPTSDMAQATNAAMKMQGGDVFMRGMLFGWMQAMHDILTGAITPLGNNDRQQIGNLYRTVASEFCIAASDPDACIAGAGQGWEGANIGVGLMATQGVTLAHSQDIKTVLTTMTKHLFGLMQEINKARAGATDILNNVDMLRNIMVSTLRQTTLMRPAARRMAVVDDVEDWAVALLVDDPDNIQDPNAEKFVEFVRQRIQQNGGKMSMEEMMMFLTKHRLMAMKYYTGIQTANPVVAMRYQITNEVLKTMMLYETLQDKKLENILNAAKLAQELS